MKKKVMNAVIIIIILLIVLVILRTAFLYIGNISISPNKDYFGDEYVQIIFPTSISDYLIAKQVINEANKALSTITDDETAELKFGNLSYLCVTHEETVKETHKLHFISANFKNNKGYIWVKYSSEGYDKNGEVICGSWGILSKWELEKVDNSWVVKSIHEHP